ncbi:YlaH-like family protein [Bacillus smithii]|uniref:YlaH-like family protein n=1 Tax=Bacillus smithii TaxID=1479 RepID=UPI002E1AF9CB|nr:YlaH-like family protein [Bacillus smithii]MED1419552.1 YlaH-like family protein [Bacillus smithii]MED1455918.1 YlaH-like family protein [Bacillus smithii]MED1488241.1 YlaH-like family protein [Bacillus smithii]
MEHVSPLLAILIQLVGVKGAVWLYFVIIIVLSILVYNLGFARKLSFGKNIVIYVLMIMGSFILLILSYQLPVVESLFVAAIVLGIYRIRRNKKEAESE